MKFEIEQGDNLSVLTLKSERLDSKIAPDLKSQIILIANTSDNGHLIVDLGSVTFADSSGLSALLMAHRVFRDSDRNLVLCNLTERINRLLEISQLEDVFTTVSDRQSAIEYLNDNPV